MRERVKDVYILLVIIMIGILVRFPISNIESIDTDILNDPDSYLYARRAIEYYNEPISEWELFTYRSEDPLMNYVDSENDGYTTNFISICVALICRVLKFLDVNSVIYYFNIVLCPLSALPTYIFAKKHFDRFGAIISSTIMALTPSYYMHTIYGVFDTDAIIMILALTSVLSSVDNYFEKNKIKQLLISIVTIVSILLFYLSWEAYYFYVAIIAIISILVLVLNKIYNCNLNIIIPTITTILSVIFCAFTSKEKIVSTINSFMPWGKKGIEYVWPSESKYVSELTIPKLFADGLNNSFFIGKLGVVNWIGGVTVFGFCIVLFIYFIFLIVKKKLPVKEVILFSLLTIWMMVSSVLVFKGIRFVQLFALPVNLFVGFGTSYVYRNSNNKVWDSWKKMLLVLLLALLSFGAFAYSNACFAILITMVVLFVGAFTETISHRAYIIMSLVVMFSCIVVNEYVMSKANGSVETLDMVEAMEYLDNVSPDDSALVVWWDQGYFTEYKTGIRTVADGGIYNGSYFYWLSNIYTTDDDNLASGICRMLSCGSLEAEKIAEEYFQNPKDATSVLKEILVLKSDDARELLATKYKLPKDAINRLLSYTHPSISGEIYFIINDRVRNILPCISYYGLWDFVSIKEYKVLYDDTTKEYIYPKEIENSVVLKGLDGDNIKGFEIIYKNETVRIYKVV